MEQRCGITDHIDILACVFFGTRREPTERESRRWHKSESDTLTKVVGL